MSDLLTSVTNRQLTREPQIYSFIYLFIYYYLLFIYLFIQIYSEFDWKLIELGCQSGSSGPIDAQ